MGGWMGTVAKLVKNCQKNTYLNLQYYRVPNQWVHNLSPDVLSREAVKKRLKKPKNTKKM